ncbi:MAG: hypothetical protein CL912_23585 [Deltaproteobacteria bacterium]|nr:hypothetical protein [Deltaproteobacteria bacterium]
MIFAKVGIKPLFMFVRIAFVLDYNEAAMQSIIADGLHLTDHAKDQLKATVRTAAFNSCFIS